MYFEIPNKMFLSISIHIKIKTLGKVISPQKLKVIVKKRKIRIIFLNQ